MNNLIFNLYIFLQALSVAGDYEFCTSNRDYIESTGSIQLLESRRVYAICVRK